MDDETTLYRVVLNQDGQYSVWPGHLPVPLGWQEEGRTGTKEACLAHIATVWSDMRPRRPGRPEAGPVVS